MNNHQNQKMPLESLPLDILNQIFWAATPETVLQVGDLSKTMRQAVRSLKAEQLEDINERSTNICLFFDPAQQLEFDIYHNHYFLAKTSTTPKVIHKLSLNLDPGIRYAVAENSHTPQGLLKRLEYSDDDDWVRYAAKLNLSSKTS